MLTDDQVAALDAAWAPARTAGVLGRATVKELWEHTAGFTAAVCSHFSAPAAELALQLVDLGTGAGVPGLLLAAQLPQSQVTLVDANERRLDHVRRARRALELDDRCPVVHDRADDLGGSGATRARFDGAVARLLSDPADAAELLSPLVRDGGVLVISTNAAARSVWAQLPVPGLPLGAAEILGGVGLLVPAVRVWAGVGLILLLLAVFPANLFMAQEAEQFRWVPAWALWARLPLQAVLIAAVAWGPWSEVGMVAHRQQILAQRGVEEPGQQLFILGRDVAQRHGGVERQHGVGPVAAARGAENTRGIAWRKTGAGVHLVTGGVFAAQQKRGVEAAAEGLGALRARGDQQRFGLLQRAHVQKLVDAG